MTYITHITSGFVPPPPPPKPKPKPLFNPYVVLGLPAQGASKAEVKKAYRRLAKENHPDLGGDEKRMKLINEAYEFLKERHPPW